MFMIPMPPTINDMEAMVASNKVIMPVMEPMISMISFWVRMVNAGSRPLTFSNRFKSTSSISAFAASTLSSLMADAMMVMA